MTYLQTSDTELTSRKKSTHSECWEKKKQGKSPTSKTPILSHPKNRDLLHFHLKHCRVTILDVTSALLHILMRNSQLETFNTGAQVWHCSLRYLNTQLEGINKLWFPSTASYLVCQIWFSPVVRKFCQFQWNKQTLHLPYKGKQHGWSNLGLPGSTTLHLLTESVKYKR